MENEWKELDVSNLPNDILKKVDDLFIYEFANFDSIYKIYVISTLLPIECIHNIFITNNRYIYYYRKRQPEKRNDQIHQAKEMASYFVNSLPKGEYKIVNDKKETVEYLYTIDDIKKAFIDGYIANEPS